MGIKTESPYKSISNNSWYKGCIHSHSITRGYRPHYPPKYKAAFMKKLGFDFMFITDHDNRLKEHRWDDSDWQHETSDFLLLKGFEFSHSWGHIGMPGYMPDENEINNMNDDFINMIDGEVYTIILNHPARWRNNLYELLTAPFIDRISAIEVYSGARSKVPERCLTADIWDGLLSNGKRIWGIAAPDCHHFDLRMTDSPVNGFQMVSAVSLDENEILNSIRKGRTYASSGVIVNEISVTDAQYVVGSENATRIEFIGAGGKVLKKVEDKSASYSFLGTEGYVRVELHNDNPSLEELANTHQSAWLQPAFINFEK